MSTTTFHFETFEAFSPFANVGPYRAADYMSLPEGELVELIEGRLIVSPPPLPMHQLIEVLLTEILAQCARRSGGIALNSPIDVKLSDTTVLQPDVIYISRARRGIIKRMIDGPPDIAVEVLSKGSGRRDRVQKVELYARYSVLEYWIVDPQAQLFEFLVNENGRFVVHSPVNDRYQSPRLPEVEIQVADFWREVTERWPAESE
jgi:Uma2 family endonuclease